MTQETAPTSGLIATWIHAMFSPRAMFSAPAESRSLWGPVAFAMTIGAFSGAAGGLLQGLLGGGSALGGVIGGLLLGPLLAVVSLFFSAVVTHFWLFVARVRPRSFKETLACVGYASGAQLFGVIPLIGGLVGGVWYLVVLGIGLKWAQRTTTARAAFATLAGPAAPILFALVLRAGFVEAFKIPAGSMMPSLMIGDHIFVNKLVYGPRIPWTDSRLFTRLPPKRGEVMVFQFPENKEQDFIKRAIAIPGDMLEAIDGRPVINGWLVPHCHVGPFTYEGRTAELFVEYLDDSSYLTLFDENPDEQACGGAEDCGAGLVCRGGFCGVLQGPFKVAPGEVWVMGDNRNNSHDSRSWRGGRGAGVPFENIKGRAMFVWMSFGPGGAIAQDRLGVDLLGPPVLPRSAAGLGSALDRCLRERPPIEKTMPPAREAAR